MIHKCGQCPQIPGFLSENLLHQHNVKEHKPKKINCLVCKAELSFNSLKVHMALHSDQKNHQCNLCYKKFKLAEYVKRHMKAHHKDESEYFNKKIDEAQLKSIPALTVN